MRELEVRNDEVGRRTSQLLTNDGPGRDEDTDRVASALEDDANDHDERSNKNACSSAEAVRHIGVEGVACTSDASRQLALRSSCFHPRVNRDVPAILP